MGMKIKRLEVEGYKSLKHIVWEPGDLNVLIGPNGSGKSNLLRLLEMLSASARGELSRFIQRDGGIGSIVWDGQAEGIKIKIETILEKPPTGKKGVHLFYDLSISRLGSSAKYHIDFEVARDHKNALIFSHKDEKVDIEGHQYEDIADYVQETIVSEIKNLTTSSLSVFIYYLLRFILIFHDLQTDNDSQIRKPTLTRHEKVLDSNGENLINVLHTLYTGDKDFEQEIDTAMQAAFSSEYEKLLFQPSAERYIEMNIRWKNLERDQPAYMLSDGILRYLFLITALANPNPPSLIAIDEPETGLHPSMFPLIAEYADEASENTQVVLSTHSPEFLNAVQEVNPNVVVTVTEWVDGETELRTISGEKLEYWLKDYKLGEMFRSGGLEAI